jgi:MoxR-like ATPase
VLGERLLDAVWLALTLEKPLLLEGEVGAGKTAIAEAIAQARGLELVRLQCYEGIDADQALYAWHYGAQLVAIQEGEDPFAARFLSPRPLLKALRLGDKACLLIDEVDRADEAFEAFLLEFLQDFRVSIPEVGTEAALAAPVVVLTSNRTRPLSDALRRRCVYVYQSRPGREGLVAILEARVPEAPEILRSEVADFFARLEELPLVRVPGPAEAIDFTRGLLAMGASSLSRMLARRALGLIAKDARDVALLEEYLAGT